MTLNFAKVRTLFWNELRMILRDRRTILTAVILPMVITPLILFGSSWTRKKREHVLETKVYHFAITGQNTNAVRTLVEMTRGRLALVNKTNGTASFKFEENSTTNASETLRLGDIDFILESFTEAAQTNALTNATASIRIIYRGDRDDSSSGMSRMEEALTQTRSFRRAELLDEHGFPVRIEKVATVKKMDIASKAQIAGSTLGRLVTLFLLVFIFSGGAIVANDLLAGEKERGTLETLLTTSATRTEIIAAKHLVIVTVAAFITFVQSMNMLLYISLKVIPVSANFAAAISPATVALLLIFFLPMAALVASVLLLTSGYAKSYKEAQLYFLPVMLLAVVPALAPMLPELPLRSIVVLLPIANIALAVKEILVGIFDWPMIVLAWLVTTGTAIWITRRSVTALSAERLITATASTDVSPRDGDSLFQRHVGRWFGLLWAVVWIVNSYTAKADVRTQVTVNLVVLFFGAALLILWRYRLNPREVFALRAPKPMVWLGVLCAIPGGILTASGLGRLAGYFFPVSSEAMEEFARVLLPEGITVPELIFFLAVLPGVFEEITFRGLLLHGLRKRLHPVALVIVVGLTFGIFHFALFRFAGTAFLGMLLAATTLLTGSIFPSMLWHFGNNALSVITELLGIPESEFDWKYYSAGAVLLVMAFWIFWRERRPYPQLSLKNLKKRI